MQKSISVEVDGVVRDCESRDYSLNMKRALEKKALRCLTDVYIRQEDKSDNHIYELSTGIYEVYKYNALHYFENVCDHSKVNVKHIKDRADNIVETQIKTFVKGASKYADQLKYCISMYHTKCKFMVNGKGIRDFVKDHKLIVKAVLGCDNLNELDGLLLDKIKDELGKIGQTSFSKGQTVSVKSVPTMRQVLGSTSVEGQNVPALELSASEHVGDRSPDSEMDGSYFMENSALLCLHCGVPMREDLIECGTCSTWYHYFCENLTRDEFQFHSDNPSAVFECSICVSIRCVDMISGSHALGPCSGGPRDILVDAGECTVDCNEQDSLYVVGSTDLVIDTGTSSTASVSQGPPFGCGDQKLKQRQIELLGGNTPVISPEEGMSAGGICMPARPLYMTCGGNVPGTANVVLAQNINNGLHNSGPLSGPPVGSFSGPGNGIVRRTSPVSTILTSSVVTSSAGSKKKTNSSRSGQSSTNCVSRTETIGTDVVMSSRVGGMMAEECNSNEANLGFSMQEQLIKSKEKVLANKEKRLKDLERKVTNREISLGDKLDQNDFSKAYIVSMENKLKELESSNRLLRLKLLAVSDDNIQDPKVRTQTDQSLKGCYESPTPNGQHCKGRCESVHTTDRSVMQDLQQRVLSLEMRALEQRMSVLESKNMNQNYMVYPSHNVQTMPVNYATYNKTQDWETSHGTVPAGNVDWRSNSYTEDFLIGSSRQQSTHYRQFPNTDYTSSGIFDARASEYHAAAPLYEHMNPGVQDARKPACHATASLFEHTNYGVRDAGRPEGHASASMEIPCEQTKGNSQRIPVHFSWRGRRPRARRKKQLLESPSAGRRSKSRSPTKERVNYPMEATQLRGEEERSPSLVQLETSQMSVESPQLE
ncbi:MAG: hypothetical protein AB2693_33275 [Candidatus Thiodiazotropha sp.]